MLHQGRLTDTARAVHEEQRRGWLARRNRLAKESKFTLSSNEALRGLGAQAITNTRQSVFRDRAGPALVCDEHVAATRQGAQCCPPSVAQCPANVSNCLHERVFGNYAIGPDLVHQFAFADQPPGMKGEKPEHHPGSRAERNNGSAWVDQRLAGRSTAW